MRNQKLIVFAKLGHFSHINDRLARQLRQDFPDHELMIVDVKDYARKNGLSAAFNIASEVATFGPSVLRSRGDLHAYFFRTPFIFRRLNQMLNDACASFTGDIDLVIQTQGLFNGRIGRCPLLIYTDYTSLDNLDEPGHDKRLFRSKMFLRYEAELYRNAEAVATFGRHVERTLINRYGCDPARVRTVYIGANVEIAPVSTELARYAARHILFVGVEWERKGGPAMVKAFTEVARDFPDARLTIVGCSPRVSHPQITVAGRVPPERMPAYFREASAFCMPSMVEPLGVAAVEASLFRLPILATRVGGLLESVTDGETGILVAPDDSAALATGMRRLFQTPDLARRMGLAGFERNRVLFDWNEVGLRLRSMACAIAPGLCEAA